jgi:hypothetical protein
MMNKCDTMTIFSLILRTKLGPFDLGQIIFTPEFRRLSRRRAEFVLGFLTACDQGRRDAGQERCQNLGFSYSAALIDPPAY